LETNFFERTLGPEYLDASMAVNFIEKNPYLINNDIKEVLKNINYLTKVTQNADISVETSTTITLKKEKVDSSFISFWNVFTEVVKNKNQKAFKDMSFDSLNCENTLVTTNKFIASYFNKIFDDTLSKRLSDKSMVEFIDEETDVNYLPKFVFNQVDKGKLIVRKVNITRNEKYPEGPTTIVLHFIKTRKGFKFYGCDKFG
jgi:hypothetical protein